MGGATRADGDFSYPTAMQQLTFAAGQTERQIAVEVVGDTRDEGPNTLVGGERFFVNLLNAQNSV